MSKHMVTMSVIKIENLVEALKVAASIILFSIIVVFGALSVAKYIQQFVYYLGFSGPLFLSNIYIGIYSGAVFCMLAIYKADSITSYLVKILYSMGFAWVTYINMKIVDVYMATGAINDFIIQPNDYEVLKIYLACCLVILVLSFLIDGVIYLYRRRRYFKCLLSK